MRQGYWEEVEAQARAQAQQTNSRNNTAVRDDGTVLPAQEITSSVPKSGLGKDYWENVDRQAQANAQAQQQASFADRAAGAVNSINNTVNNLRPLAGRVVYNAAKAIENIANPDSSIKSGLSNAAKAVNDFKNKYIHDPAVEYGRNAARAYLPEGMENKFIGSKGDEEFLQTYSDNNVPSYKQIKELMQSNAITKQQALEQTALRAKLDRLTAEKEYTDERNKNLGLGALVLGSSLIPGVNIAGKALPAAASSTAVKTTPKALSLMKSGALNGAIGGGAYGLGESFIDDKVNPISSVPQSAALASAFGSVLSPALGFGIAAAPYAGRAAKNAVKETVSRLNPKNYERILKYGKPRRRGTGLSGREVYEPEYKWMYKPNERLYNARRAAESYQYPADDNVISAQFNAGEARQRKPAEGESVSDKIAELAPNIAEKQKNNAKIINDLYNSENIESEPEKYTGKRSVKDVLTYLGSTDGKTAVVKTPIEDVIFDKSNVAHLLYDNNSERLKDLNKVKKTLETPNIVINSQRSGHNYNYYIKSYKGDNKVSAHLQVVKKCDDGNFYVTNYPVRSNKIDDLLKTGRTVYSSSVLDSTYTDNGVPVNNSITDNKVNFKGDETKTNLEQLAPKTAAKLGLVIPENTPVVQRERQSDVNLEEDKKHYSKFYDERQQNIRNAKEAGKDIKGMQADARQVLYTAIEKTYPNYSKAAINRAISIVTSDKKYKTPAMRRYAEKLEDAITDKLDDKIEALSGVEGTFPELSYDNRPYVDYEEVMEKALQILKGNYSRIQKDEYGFIINPKDIYEYAENQRTGLDFILSRKGSDITTDELLDEKNNINSYEELQNYLIDRGPSDPDNAENEEYWRDVLRFARDNWKYISDTREELQNALKDIRIEEEKAEIRKNARADRRRNKSKNQGVERLAPGPGRFQDNLYDTTANEINAQHTGRNNYEAERNGKGARQGAAGTGAEAARVSSTVQSSNLEQITSQKPAATKQDLVNKYYEQCKNTDMTDEQAASAGELISEMISATADGMGISIAQADKRFGMIIKSMTAGQAKAQWAKDNNKGTFDKSNPNIYYQSAGNGSGDVKVTPVHIDKNSVPKFEKVSELKQWIADNLNLIGEVNIKSNGRSVNFSKSNISRSMKGVNRDKSGAKLNSYAGLRELAENAQYSYDKPVDEKHKGKNNGQEIYHNAFEYDGKVYGIEISVDVPLNKNARYTYAGHKIEAIKKAPAASEVSPNGQSFDTPSANISITDIQKLFKPQSDTAGNIDNAKGFTYERTNDTGESENFIGLLQGKADMSTIVHEAGHVWLTVLNKAAEEGSQAAQKMTARINKWLGSDDGNYTDEQHEKFAESFVEYIRTNKAPNSGLREVFRKFKKWLNDIYQNIKTKIKLSAEAKEVFDELFGKRKPAEGSTGNDTSGMSRIEQLAPKTAAKIRFQKEEKGIGLSRLRRTEESGDEQQSGSREKDIDKASKIKQSDNTAQKTAKQAIREWKAGVETDRYDVDKALNSFIIHTKQTAKDLSKTTGMKVNDKLVREIMPFLRERTGVPEKLGRKDLTKLYNRLSKSDKARLTAFADEVSNKFQKYYENYNNVRGVVPESVIENHISHIWDLDKKQTGLLTSYFSTKSRFGKERTIETLMKGINGIETETGEIISLKPKTLDYAEILKISSDSLIKAAHDSLLAQRVKNLTHNGEKLVKRLDKAPADWVKIEHPALSKALYRGETSEGEKIWENLPAAVHPDIADTLLTVFEIQKPDNAGLKGYDTLSAFMKQAQLGFSGFHGFALSEAAIGNMGLGRTLKVLNPMRIIKEISSGNYSVYKEDSIAKHAIEHGLQLGTPTDLDRNMVEKLVTSAESSLSKVSYIGKAAELLGKGWDNTAGKILGGGIKLNNKVLWNYLHNNFKLETYKFLIERQTKANKGKLSEDDFNEIAQWVNDSFGGQAWELLGVKPSAQKQAKRAMLSPDWFVSTLRQFMGMFATETGSRAVSKAAKTKAFWKKVQKGSEALGIDSITDNINSSGMRGKIARAFWIRSLIYMTIGYNLLNAAMREKDRKDNPEYYTGDKIDYSLWGNYKPSDKLTDKALPRVFIGRNSEGKELYMRWGKQFREVPELITSPREHLGNKAAPLLQLGSKLAYGHSLGGFEDKNFFEKKGGQKVMKQGAELAKARAGAIGNAMLPISVQNTKDRSKSTPWALFQPVSKGMSFYTARESFEKIYEKGGKAEDIERTKDLAYRAGMDKKSIESARKQAYNDFTAPYKEAFINALEKDNSSKIEQIGKEMDKKHIAPAEQQKIYMKALKEYYKSKGISF